MTAIATRSGTTFTQASGGRRTRNLLATGLMWAAFLVALVPLLWLLWTVLSNGLPDLLHASWWTGDQRGITSSTPGGGVLHAIVGTVELVAVTTLISVPVAVLVAVYLVEYGKGWFARVTTFMVDILTGIPSIVAGLFIFALFITTLGGNKAEWLASLALVILMVPVVVRSTETMLRLVPNELREASYALGIPKWRTIVKVVLPTAFSGIVTGIVLGIARVAGETAPLLVLVGYTASMQANPFSGFQASLPLEIKQQFININTAVGGGGYHYDANGNLVQGATANFAPDRMWATALTLILIVVLLNVIARVVGRRATLTR